MPFSSPMKGTKRNLKINVNVQVLIPKKKKKKKKQNPCQCLMDITRRKTFLANKTTLISAMQ